MTMLYTEAIHLTADERDVLTAYLRVCADQLGLKDWAVELDLYPSQEGTAGTMNATWGRRVGVMHLGPRWREQDLDELRDTFIHELLHLQLWELESSVDLIEDHLAPPALAVFAKAQHRQLEIVVDALACAIAPFFPYPPDALELAVEAERFRRRNQRLARAAARDSIDSGSR